MRCTTSRRPWTAAAGAALLAPMILLSGCVIYVGDDGYAGRTYRYDEVRTLRAEYVDAAPVRVETDQGSIRIRKADVDRVAVEARVYSRSRDRMGDIGVRAERGPDGALLVEALWPGGVRRSGDAVSFDVAVPDAIGVVAHTGDGAITIEGLTGQLAAETGDGAITIRHHDGSVDVHTGDGRITLIDIVGAVNARTSDGAIQAVGIAGAVDLHTGDGSVELALTPDNPGPLRAHTSDGNIVLRIGPAFVGRLALQTRDGRVAVRDIGPGASAAIETLSQELVVLRFGDSDQRSVATTSDGYVTLTTLRSGPSE